MLSVFSGSRAEIGAAHGRAHAALIASSLEVYDRLFHDFVGLRWAEARRSAERFLPMIERGFPAILDEMAGIAQGAGLELEDILTLNCRSEISLTQASGGCTALAAHRDGTQWLAQNWDWRGDQRHNVVAMELHPDDAPALVSVGEAGMVAKIGLNAHGVGVCLNAIRSRTCGEGLPIHVALRKILEAESFDAATRVATHDRVCSPAHLLIASGDGRAAGYEVHPGLPGVLEPRGGTLTHSNHLIAEAATCQVQDFPRPDSALRLSRIERLLHERLATSAALDTEALFTMLADHDNAPSAICRHDDPQQPEAERMETLFAVVMNLHERRLTLRHGKPCDSEDTLVARLTPA
ncbi:C45 family autoproteolytic acyltransferase/hydolase [Halomonas borealis]|uniref:C45 family autoproteolytic acyltransferase/hydolase n=1 Tax=Halomonas borealis TaxID=2508710 RepID=UPI00109FC9AB|nr:C45 family peptidase [Halomonas borealis]